MKAQKIIIIALSALTVCLLFAAFVLVSPETIPDENVTRITAPDQTEPMEHEAFIPEPYDALVFEGTNVALGADAECSSFTNPYVAAKAVDGKTEGSSYWEGKPDTYPHSLTVDLGEAKSIHAIRVALCPLDVWGRRTQTFTVYISADGTSFTELVPLTQYTFDPAKGNEVGIEFDSVSVRFVMLEFTENSGATGGQVAELEVYAIN